MLIYDKIVCPSWILGKVCKDAILNILYNQSLMGVYPKNAGHPLSRLSESHFFSNACYLGV